MTEYVQVTFLHASKYYLNKDLTIVFANNVLYDNKYGVVSARLLIPKGITQVTIKVKTAVISNLSIEVRSDVLIVLLDNITKDVNVAQGLTLKFIVTPRDSHTLFSQLNQDLGTVRVIRSDEIKQNDEPAGKQVLYGQSYYMDGLVTQLGFQLDNDSDQLYNLMLNDVQLGDTDRIIGRTIIPLLSDSAETPLRFLVIVEFPYGQPFSYSV